MSKKQINPMLNDYYESGRTAFEKNDPRARGYQVIDIEPKREEIPVVVIILFVIFVAVVLFLFF